jgi:hypothetical protein
MCDIKEDIDDIEMDDFDGNRARKIREYSFSPTKTPSKRGRDELHNRRYISHNNRKPNIPDPAWPYNKNWMSGEASKYVHGTPHSFKHHLKTLNAKKYDIDKLRMIDQPNYDGVDKHITIWCSCKNDVKPYFCSSVRDWVEFISDKFNYFKWKESYENLLRGQEQKKQITRDIERTFKKFYCFKYPSMVHKLSRVLNAIAIYDDKLGYVQGMNFVAGAFLIHCEEFIAFWLVIELLEFYELREVYDDGLKGMYRHSGILEKFMQKYQPEILEHFETIDVRVEMFMSDWVISFLCSYIPLSRLDTYFSYFFRFGWKAFHCMVLAILENMKSEILNSIDMPACINTIKTMKEHRNSFKVNRTEKSNKKRAERMGNRHETFQADELSIDDKNELSLDYRKRMAIENQETSDEEWDEIFEIMKKFINKIKNEEYLQIYSSVTV